jgi:hypothetical protein
MAVVILCTAVIVPIHLNARDDGRFANSPLKEWFDRLASKNGLCCAFADGVSLQDVDWDTQDGPSPTVSALPSCGPNRAGSA